MHDIDPHHEYEFGKQQFDQNDYFILIEDLLKPNANPFPTPTIELHFCILVKNNHM